MTTVLNKDRPALFLGVADFLESSGTPFPLGGVDLFQLSQHKSHIVYPGIIASNVWIVLVSTEFLEERDLSKWKLRIADESDAELGILSFSSISNEKEVELRPESSKKGTVLAILKDNELTMVHFSIDALVNYPGRYTVQSIYDGKVKPIGSVHFHYQKAPP